MATCVITTIFMTVNHTVLGECWYVRKLEFWGINYVIYKMYTHTHMKKMVIPKTSVTSGDLGMTRWSFFASQHYPPFHPASPEKVIAITRMVIGDGTRPP
jgi:hypothetical protein